MVKIPGYEDRGSVDTGVSSFRSIQADDDVGRAAQRFAGGLGDLAVGIARRDAQLDAKNKAESERMDTVRAQNTLLDLRLTTQERLKDSVANMDPADPNFYPKFRAETDRIYSEAVSKLNLSGPLADKVELQFREAAVGFNSMALSQATAARQKYVQDTLKKTADTYGTAILSGTMDRDTARAEAATVVDQMGLPPEAAEMTKKHVNSVIDGAFAQRYTEQNGTQGYREMRDQLAPRYKIGSEAAHPLHNRMLEAAERHGLPAWMLPFVASRENAGLNPTLQNKHSSAFGLFQFINDDWKETGIPKSADPNVQIEAAAIRMGKVVRFIEAQGAEVTPTTVYAAHLLGRAGFARLNEYMTLNPNADARTVYAQVAGADIARKAFNGSNGQLLVQGATVAQTMAAIDKYARAGMDKTAAMLKAEKEMPDPNAPITLGGVVLDGLTKRDATAIHAKSLDVARRDAEAYVKAANKAKHMDFLSNGYDTDDRKAANDIDRENQIGDRMATGDVDAYAFARQYAQQARFVSRNVSAAAELMMESPDAGLKLKGYELGRTVHNADPSGGLHNSSFDEAKRRKIEAYTAIINTGGQSRVGRDVTPGEQQRAIAVVERAYQVDKDFQKLTDKDRERITDVAKSRTYVELASKAQWSKTWFGLGRADTGPQNVAIQGMLEREYREAFMRHYKDTNGSGDGIELATARAATEVTQRLGVSQVMGNANRTLYPPERVLPPVDGNHDWVRRQVLDAVAADVTARNKGKDLKLTGIDPKKVYIVGDSTTGHDVNAGRVPSYEVYYINPAGEEEKLNSRWRPSMEALNSPVERDAQLRDRASREAAGAPAPATMRPGLADELAKSRLKEPQKGRPQQLLEETVKSAVGFTPFGPASRTIRRTLPNQ